MGYNISMRLIRKAAFNAGFGLVIGIAVARLITEVMNKSANAYFERLEKETEEEKK